MSKIVSANYRDRNSAFRWLVRDESEPADMARAFKAVVAEGVRFVDTHSDGDESGPNLDYERGFGCGLVAVCDSVETRGEMDPFTGGAADGFDSHEDGYSASEEGFERLVFVLDDFLKEGASVVVKGASSLYLRPDGAVFAGGGCE